MTLLVDHQIERLARQGMIQNFYVEKYKRGLSAGLTSCGYDARLGSELYEINPGYWPGGCIDPMKGAQDDDMKITSIADYDTYILEPGAFTLGHTIETFAIPADIKAICHGKSTYARCGIHVNVTPLEPGWTGQVTLEIFNQSPRPVLLYPGRGICQFEFHRLLEPPIQTYADKGGKYQGQTGVTFAKGLE